MTKSKIFMNPQTLCRHIDECRSRGLKIVTANGCFELVHVGHVRYLQEAKTFGDILIVAVNTDASMKLIKPDRNPVNPDVERMEIIAALESVDYVVPLEESTPDTLLKLFRPDIHTKGTDYSIEEIPERGIVESYGGKVELVGGPKVRNTRDMLKELRER